MPTEAIVDIHAGTMVSGVVVRKWRITTNDCGGGAAWSTEARVALADTGLRRRDHVGIEGPRPSASIMHSFIWVQLIGSNPAGINCLHHSSCI